MRFSHLVEHVSKKPVLPHVNHFIVEVMVTDENDDDVEVSQLLSVLLWCISHQCQQVPFIVVRK
jgi:Ubiquitin fold domain